MKPSQILKGCLNWKVILPLGIAVLLAYVFVPQIANYAWVLLVLVCPLSMIFMMTGMKHGEPEKVFGCAECGLSYKNAEWAKKCAAWCKEHHSCNLEITEHAIKDNN